MLTTLNTVANLVIFLGTVWALFTHKIPTRTCGSAVLGFIAVASLVNLDTPGVCHSRQEVMLNLSFAIAVVWAFWHVEIRKMKLA